MEHKHLFSIEWNHRAIAFFIFLAIVPNVLGMLNIATPLGFSLHTFQLGIFLAALLFGPVGGLVSGLVGSTYAAIVMHNPYLALGNAILGFAAGLFMRYGLHTVIAVLLAFLVQLPWLAATDLFLMHLPLQFVTALVIALAASNLIWAIVAHYAGRYAKALIG